MRRALLRKLERQALEAYCRAAVRRANGDATPDMVQTELAARDTSRILRLAKVVQQLGPDGGVTRLAAQRQGVADLPAWVRWYTQVQAASRTGRRDAEVAQLFASEPRTPSNPGPRQQSG